MDKRKVREISKRILVRFFLAMVLFTFLSRAMDSIVVTKVNVASPSHGKVLYEIKGDGTLKGEDFVFVSLPADMRVAKLHKSPGQVVSAGEELVTFQSEAIEKQKSALEIQLLKAQLLLEEEKINAMPLPELSEETLAFQELENARRERNLSNEKLQKAQVDYTEKTSDLKAEYERKSVRSDQQIRSDGRGTYHSAKRAYENALLTQESAIKKGERQVNDKEKGLKRMEESGASQEEIDEALTALDRAIEDLEEIKQEQELLVEDAEERMYEAEDDYGDTRYDKQDAEEELRAGYEAAVKTEDEKLELAYEQVRGMEDGVRKFQMSLENARIKDQNKIASSQRLQKLSIMRQKSLELDVSEISQKLEKLQDLEMRQGKLLSPVDGIVASIELEPGEIMTGTKQISIAQGNLILQGSVDKESGKLVKEGTRMNVKTGEAGRGYEASIQSVDTVSEEEQVCLSAKMPDGAGHLGATASFTLSLEAGPYNQVIPVEAVREDSKGYYCLAVETKRTILGEELTAVRIHLNLLEKSSTSAAVEGALTNQSKVILSSDKPVSEGDRVRVISQ